MPNQNIKWADMLPEKLKTELERKIQAIEHPRELVIDVMRTIQSEFGYLSDDGVKLTARMLNMNPVEVEELATFYNFIYREAVGKHVIHVCDSLMCEMDGYLNIKDYLCQKLNIELGQTSANGLFTLLPTCCLGYCDRSPAMLVDGKTHGNLTFDKLDTIIETLRGEK
jgi:NADH-quinone oxidoreductase subunit E